jgi:hypothetical protein
MARKLRTVEELQEASNHLFYEIWMLGSVAKGLASGVAGQGPIANALIEFFVIHVRAVMDFLYADKPQSDDVIAEDYFDDPEQWAKHRPELSQLLIHAKRRAGKEVAHLTYARLDVTPETKPWQFVEIANEISTALQAFLAKVPRNKLGSQWKASLQ